MNNERANHYIDFCCGQAGLLLLPAELISAEGVQTELRNLLLNQSLNAQDAAGQTLPLDDAWFDLLDAALRCYWQRTAELYQRAPQYWFPPRVQHLAIVTDIDTVRPYFQPLHQSSWLLYASDFAPRYSNVEFAVYHLLLAERMGLLQQVIPAIGANLSYWLLRSGEEAQQFQQASEHNPRPDIHSAQALAKVLPWLRQLNHPQLRPLQSATMGEYGEIPGTGILMPRRRAVDLDRLVQTCTRSVQGVAERFFHTQSQRAKTNHHSTNRRSADHAEALCQWLQQERPRLLITKSGGEVIWDFQHPEECTQLKPVLSDIGDRVAASLQADWAVVGTRSQSFVNSLRDQHSLPPPQPHFADQDGLSYMHLQRREVAYNLHEKGMQRLREASPPFERWMLAARTIHEWGHLCVEQGWVPMSLTKADYRERLLAFEECVGQMLNDVPARVLRAAETSLSQLRKSGENHAQALVRLSLKRMEDFQANLVAARYLRPVEMETYVRNNHRSHVQGYQNGAIFQRLMRYAYEFQYLRFSRMEDPMAFVNKTTWIQEQYVQPGLLSAQRIHELFMKFTAICDAYRVDEDFFRTP